MKVSLTHESIRQMPGITVPAVQVGLATGERIGGGRWWSWGTGGGGGLQVAGVLYVPESLPSVGTERMSELQVWNYIQELWIVVRENQSLERISVIVKQAVKLIDTEVCNICEGEEGMELLACIPDEEDLLVPEKEFLDSRSIRMNKMIAVGRHQVDLRTPEKWLGSYVVCALRWEGWSWGIRGGGGWSSWSG